MCMSTSVHPCVCVCPGRESSDGIDGEPPLSAHLIFFQNRNSALLGMFYRTHSSQSIWTNKRIEFVKPGFLHKFGSRGPRGNPAPLVFSCSRSPHEALALAPVAAGRELVVIRISLQLTRAPSSSNLNKDRDSQHIACPRRRLLLHAVC